MWNSAIRAKDSNDGGFRRRNRNAAAAIVLSLGLTGCGLPPARQEEARREEARTSAPTLLSLREGVPLLAGMLVKRASLPPPPPSGRYPVVIDPWIDAVTGSQIATAKLMQEELEALAPAKFPQLELLPFTPETLDRRPVVLLGALAPVAGPGATTPVRGNPGAWRVYGILADLGTGRVASTASIWVRPQDIDPTPVPFYRDSPVWQQDESVLAYLRFLNARQGDPIDPAYVRNLRAEALIVKANAAYGQGDYLPARTLYRQAAVLPEGGHQLRVYNGLYLTNNALGDRDLAMQSFAELVNQQVLRGRLSVKILFRPNATAFWSDPEISGPYPTWLRIIANRVAEDRVCLRVTGHTSPSGPPEANERLSLARAQRIEDDLTRLVPALRGRIEAAGMGARETVIGTGRDDATDVLDRRVDFQIQPCAQMANAPFPTPVP